MSALTSRIQELVPAARLHKEADSDRSVVVYGPPGTGKTTALLGLVDAHLAAGAVQPDRLAILTFTRGAKAEALGRLKAATGLDAEYFPWVRTIHSACYHLLGMTPATVIGPKDMEAFGDDFGYEFSGGRERNVDDPFGAASVRTFGDWALAAEDLRRAKMITVEEAVATFRPPIPAGDGWNLREASRFSTKYRGWKNESGKADFTDMLERALRDKVSPAATHLFVDEAQDLTPLQWALIDLWALDAKRVLIFGDDDQAIFEWSGADPRALIARAGHQMVLSHTYRLPSKIHAEASRIIRRVRNRVPKDFEPVGEGGQLGNLWDWMELHPPATGRMLVLARNRSHLEAARRELRERGFPFADRVGNSGVPAADGARGRAIRAAMTLSRREPVAGRSEISNLRRQVWPDLWPGDKIAKQPTYMLDDLFDCGATDQLVKTLATNPLQAFRMARDEQNYLGRMVAFHGPQVLTEKPRIELSTIHGVKGEEAEHVVVCTSMTRQTYDEYQVNPDAEHRVMYVAASRAKESLKWLQMRGNSYDV